MQKVQWSCCCPGYRLDLYRNSGICQHKEKATRDWTKTWDVGNKDGSRWIKMGRDGFKMGQDGFKMGQDGSRWGGGGGQQDTQQHPQQYPQQHPSQQHHPSVPKIRRYSRFSQIQHT